MACARGLAGDDVAGAEIVAVGLDQQLAVGRPRGRGHQRHLVMAGCVAVEFEPRMRHRMRLDRNHLAALADLTRQRERVGADIGADIDEHAANGSMGAQKIQFLEIVVGIEQRAALGGAGLMIEPERRALILHVDRTGAQQVDQPRQHRPERAALQPRALCKSDDRCLCGIRRERAEWRGGGVVVRFQTGLLEHGRRGACIAGPPAGCRAQICRSTIFSLSSAMASAGLRPFGQALAQFMMVWQR